METTAVQSGDGEAVSGRGRIPGERRGEYWVERETLQELFRGKSSSSGTGWIWGWERLSSREDPPAQGLASQW